MHADKGDDASAGRMRLTRLPPPRIGRRGHRRRYFVQPWCYRFGGGTEAQAVIDSFAAWASSSPWRPCSTAPIGGGSRAHRSCWRSTAGALPTRGGEPDPGKYQIQGMCLGKNHIHESRLEGGENQIQGATRRGQRTTSSDHARKEPAPRYDSNRRETAHSDRR